MDTTIASRLAGCAERCAELEASRLRLIADHDAEVERIERDLHDGLQQRLTTLGMELQLLEASPPPGDHALTGVGAELAALAATARRLSRRIFPAILAEAGIGPALRSYARQAPLPVELHLAGLGRYPAMVEMTVYRLVAGVAEHASGTYVSVRAGERTGRLRLVVAADGDAGILIGPPVRDRLDALAATLHLEKADGGATAVIDFPVAPAVTD